MPGQNACSLLTGMPRISAMPQARPSPGGKRRLLNGIGKRHDVAEIGVSRPCDCHTVSKLMSSFCPSVVIPSAWIPSGFEKNM